MADENEVKDVEVINVEPSTDDEVVKDESVETDNEETETPGPSSDDKKPEDEQPPKEEVHQRQVVSEKKEPKPVEGETPREYALRKEVERLRQKARGEQTKGVFGETPQVEKPAPTSKSKEVLGKYNPEEVQNFKEVMEAVADDLGYVRKDEYQKTTYASQREEVLNQFLDAHPEYAPENDKDDLLWNRFKEELKMYRDPANPKDYKKIFDRVHKDIFSIQTDPASINKIKAGQEKLKVASHASASSNRPITQRNQGPALDPSLKVHMKGFDDEELSDIFED